MKKIFTVCLLIGGLLIATDVVQAQKTSSTYQQVYELVENRVNSDMLQDKLMKSLLSQQLPDDLMSQEVDARAVTAIALDIFNIDVQDIASNRLEHNLILSDGTFEKGATNGDIIEVDYYGFLPNAELFDDSFSRGETFLFQIGKQQVILGWDKGLVGVKPGDVIQLVIGSDYAFGELGVPGGPIPPNSALIFLIQIKSITPSYL